MHCQASQDEHEKLLKAISFSELYHNTSFSTFQILNENFVTCLPIGRIGQSSYKAEINLKQWPVTQT